MNDSWQISRDDRAGYWLGISPTLKLTVQAETLPALRESIEEAEALYYCEQAAAEGFAVLDHMEQMNDLPADDLAPPAPGVSFPFPATITTREKMVRRLRLIGTQSRRIGRRLEDIRLAIAQENSRKEQ